jgi:dTDP-4-amino-4,6-dideoxygalactose transaminase
MSQQSKNISLFKVHIHDESAINNIRDVFHSGFINEGVEVTQLTSELSSRWVTNHLLLTNSCTSAITIALHIAKNKKSNLNCNSHVITTPMTCVATNTPIVTLGLKIRWADIDENTGMIDPVDVKSKINSDTVAVIAVAWAGTPPELQELRKICDDANVPLILDAAHAFDAKFKDVFIHEWADFTCYSFQAIKHFTTGDGGALICKSKDNFDTAKALKWFGLDRDHAKDSKGNWKGQQWDVDIVHAGYKFNMNNISAAIGLSQLQFINEIISKHRNNAVLYDNLFKEFKYVRHLKRPKHSESSHWVYTMKLTSESKISRDELLKKLNQRGIMAGVVHVPNDTYTTFKMYEENLPGVRAFSSMQFSLPCGWWVTAEDVAEISRSVIELIS